MVFALWDRAKLAEDSTVEDSPGWGGVTLALCLGSREEVDAVTEEARSAGATIGREPDETFWGGYSSIMIDPDGPTGERAVPASLRSPWEIAHSPGLRLTEDGGARLPA